MRKAIALAACLAVLTAGLFTRPTRSAPQRPLQDEIARRKAAASESKPRKQPMPASVQDFGSLKAAARARKTVQDAREAEPQPEQVESDILAQSSKLSRHKNVPQEDFGRSAEMVQTFDSLREKAQAAGAVRVIVGLRSGFEPEGELPTFAAVQAQRRGISDAQDELLARLPATGRGSITRFETVPYIALEVDADGVQALRASPVVTSIVEDVHIPPALAESVPLIGAPTAWAAGFSGAGQTVAVLDTGVDKTHSFLAGKVVSEACFSTTGSSPNTSSFCPGGAASSTSSGSGVNCSVSVAGCDHGTHVAGIAAGKSAGFSGVARDANIIAIQIFSRFNNSSDCGGVAPCVRTFGSDQMKGLERVFALRGSFNIASANMSIGGGQNSSNCDTNPLKPIIDNLRSVGIATVIASGNEGFKDSLSSPACISSAISVGSTNDGSGSGTTDTVSSFSNSASFLSLLAPGSLIRSSIPGGSFSNFQGTSMATPHVAG
ncbi:MAG TPA: S8 family serine peptidase, partial [Pyrinomonadaceae bacterium]|nr:S8 family serine peptidase [Pyrinomonadaceae bacterium]